jgi:hypothetical protein
MVREKEGAKKRREEKRREEKRREEKRREEKRCILVEGLSPVTFGKATTPSMSATKV